MHSLVSWFVHGIFQWVSYTDNQSSREVVIGLYPYLKVWAGSPDTVTSSRDDSSLVCVAGANQAVRKRSAFMPLCHHPPRILLLLHSRSFVSCPIVCGVVLVPVAPHKVPPISAQFHPSVAPSPKNSSKPSLLYVHRIRNGVIYLESTYSAQKSASIHPFIYQATPHPPAGYEPPSSFPFRYPSMPGQATLPPSLSQQRCSTYVATTS